MAKQAGIFEVKGTIGEVTFYRSKNGSLIRRKGGVSKERFKNDPSFARTRENISEFSGAGLSAKLLRDSIRPLLSGATDSKIVGRMQQLMVSIQKQDITSTRGKRNVGAAQALTTAKQLIKNFNFNRDALLSSILIKPVVINATPATMVINGLLPLTDLIYPVEATHVNISGAVLNINFATGVVDVKYTNVATLAINAAATTVTLTPSAVPAGTGIRLYVLKVEYAQLINASNYPLKNGAFTSLAIIEVA